MQAKRGGKKSQNGRNEEKARCPRSRNEKNIDARTIPKWDADKRLKWKKKRMMKDRKEEFGKRK